MRIGNCVLDQRVLDCFSTLGLEPTGNMCEIQRAYRDSVRMVHPDRAAFRSGLAWTKEECEVAFGTIRDAYEYLRGQFMEVDLPDYDILYTNDCDLAGPNGISLEEFNKRFEEANGTLRSSEDPPTKTLDELIAERDLPIPEDLRPKVAAKDMLVRWPGDPVAGGHWDPMVLGGDYSEGDVSEDVSVGTGLDAAYGHPMVGVWGDAFVVSERDYPGVQLEYVPAAPEYSETVAREEAEREEAARKLEAARRERVALMDG